MEIHDRLEHNGEGSLRQHAPDPLGLEPILLGLDLLTLHFVGGQPGQNLDEFEVPVSKPRRRAMGHALQHPEHPSLGELDRRSDVSADAPPPGHGEPGHPQVSGRVGDRAGDAAVQDQLGEGFLQGELLSDPDPKGPRVPHGRADDLLGPRDLPQEAHVHVEPARGRRKDPAEGVARPLGRYRGELTQGLVSRGPLGPVAFGHTCLRRFSHAIFRPRYDGIRPCQRAIDPGTPEARLGPPSYEASSRSAPGIRSGGSEGGGLRACRRRSGRFMI